MKRVCKKLISGAMVAVMVAACAPTLQSGFIAPLRVEVSAAQEIGITECAGWLESAWVEWSPSSTSGVSYYRVSYSKDGSSFTTIDDELVRMYKDGHWRADIVGISAGAYTIKVEAYNSANEAIASETASATVESHDRTGFNFSPASTCYDSSDPLQSGGYKGDGTPKDGVEILYITSASDIDTVTDSTGTTGLSTILQGRNKRTDVPLIVRIVGKIDYSGSELNSSGYIQIKPSKSYTNYNTTIEGIGEDASVNFGFLLRNAGNVEIRNLAVHDFGDDGISLDTDNCNIWLHNNEFFYGEQGSGDKAKGDGSSDVKNDSQFVTLSYNHYWDAGKCSLCGMTSETGENYITYHHNWFDHSDSRHPRIRTMFVHVFNNYYDGNAKYGIGASADSDAFVEGNYFRNCKYPTLQGSVGHDSDGKGSSNTFDDSPAIGAIKLYNNIMEGSLVQFTAGSDGETSSNADGCVVTTRNQRINYTTSAGATYSNADVDDAYVQSLADVVQQPADAKVTVEKYAGRTGGGDFAQATGFAFNDSVDDSDYEINTTLRSAITNYVSNNISSNHVIASVGGSLDGSIVPEPPTESTTSDPATETTTDEPVTEPTTSSLKVLDTGSYAAADIVSDTAKFLVTGNSGKNGQLKIDESGSVKFNVASGANVSISYKCGSSDSSKSASISCAGKTGETLVGSSGSNPLTSTLELSGLSAGEYTITASQNGGTTAQIISVAVSYSGDPTTQPTTETTTETTTQSTTEPTTETTTSEPVTLPDGKIWGDADDSGVLTANDAASILHYVLYPASSPIKAEVLPLCDVNANGSVDGDDGAMVLQKTLFADFIMPAEK